MSTILYGAQINPVPGWSYAEESDTPGEPSTFTPVTLYPRDRNGNYFKTGTEYRYYAKRDLDGEIILLRFTLDAFGNPLPVDDIPDDLRPTIVKLPYLDATTFGDGRILKLALQTDGSYKIIGVDAGSLNPTLNQVLTADPRSDQPIELFDGALIRQENGANHAETGIDDGGGLVTKYNGVTRQITDTNGVQVFGTELHIEGRTNADKLGVRTLEKVQTSPTVLVPVTRNGIKEVAEMDYDGGAGVNEDTDYLFKHTRQKNFTAFDGNTPFAFGVILEVAPGIREVQTWSPSALLNWLLPQIPSSTGNGSTDSRAIRFLGCIDEPKAPQNTEEVLIAEYDTGVLYSHNIQTTQGYCTDAFIYNTTTSHYEADDTLKRAVRFPDVNHIGLDASVAASYDGLSLMIYIKRVASI